MTSGEVHSFPISSIFVNRDERQRRELKPENVNALADSFNRIGQLHPIVIQRDGLLIAGETRLAAARSLGWTSILAHFTDELDQRVLLSIELEENIKRTDLSWQEQVAAVKKYHDLQRELEPNWSTESTAQALGLSERSVSEKLSVGKAMENGDERVLAAPKYSTARGIVARQAERSRSDELLVLPEKEEADAILNVDFLQWAPEYAGPSFNLIHCDFPYGIDYDKANQSANPSLGGYKDSAELYFSLLDCLVDNRERLLGESGHVFFWFSMTHYTMTLASLRKAFWVDPFPFIWYKSDNTGVLPFPEKSGRRVYETAFLCSYGDRKIIQPVSNLFPSPVGDRIHTSEKAQPMLQNFFRMFIDDNTRLLDPTCGSGSSLRAAQAMGAKSILGLEINAEFAATARRALRSQNA